MSKAGSVKLSIEPTAVAPMASAAELESNAPMVPLLPAAIEQGVPAATIRETTMSQASDDAFSSSQSQVRVLEIQFGILMKVGGASHEGGSKNWLPMTRNTPNNQGCSQ